MEEKEFASAELTDEIGRFTETYSSFTNIINQIQRQYLSLKDTYEKQSGQLQDVNLALQTAIARNREVSEFLSRILNSLTSGIVAINSREEITHINPAALRILHISGETAASRQLKLSSLYEPLDGASFSAAAALRNGKTCINAEKKIKTHDGHQMILLISTSTLNDISGAVIGAVEIFQDITGLKRLEEELSRMQVLAGLGEMAATIAHEVRNPLVAIGGFAALLARDLKNQPDKLAMAEKIVAGVNNINRTVETLLVFARRDEISKIPVNLGDFLDTVIDGISEEYALLETPVKIERNIAAADEVYLRFDPHLLRQAIYNLAKNGIEADLTRPSIAIRCAVLTQAEASRMAGKQPDSFLAPEYMLIAVDDNGKGIPDSELSKIFSPFYSTKSNGTGLGLSIAWKIIKAHGGEIQAAARPGHGTTFSILLPMNQEDSK